MITIEKVGADSIPAIQQIVNIAWPATYGKTLPPDQLEYMLKNIYSSEALQQQIKDGQQFIIAREEEQPVAFAAYFPKENNPLVYKLHKIYILPNQQGKGLGRRLIDFVIKEMHPCTLLQLNVYRQNKARYFYEKLGFRIVSEIDIPAGEGFTLKDYIMELSIP